MLSTLKWMMYRVWWWLLDVIPMRCDCGHVCHRRDVHFEITTWGHRVSYCSDCHSTYFYEGRQL